MVTSKRGYVRIGVVGTGRMGQHHLRVYDLLKGVELVGLYDPNEPLATETAQRYGCQQFDSLEALARQVDAVSVAVPSGLHAQIGCQLLDLGIHCLIEKPMATTAQDCLELIHAAQRGKAILLIGHVERFNPAVRQLSSILPRNHEIYAIDARRMSAASSRITDVDVVSDLMIHDLDIALALVNKPIRDLTAKGLSINGSVGEDYVSALLQFEGGTLVSLTASRITQNKIRELQLSTNLGFITLNYATQDLFIYRQGYGGAHVLQSEVDVGYRLDLAIDRIFVRSEEPLMAELRHFVHCVQEGMTPLVTGQQAYEAMQLVWEIRELCTKTFRHE
ncbi:MAG: Gfo/Idh/MocA family oxidoreductase [Magnetococcus sp. DMHC-6]